MASSIDIGGNKAEAGSVQMNTVHFNTTQTAEDIDRACLNALRCPNPLDAKTRLKEKDKLLPGSINWLMKDPSYEKWHEDPDVSLLWLKGGAGKGKTMMTISLVERLQRERPWAVTYFFCQNTYEDLNTIEGMLKGLIFCLVKQRRDLLEPLRDRWNREESRFNQDLTTWPQLWKVFFEMLEASKKQGIYVVVDALDECQQGSVAEFLKLIVRTGLGQNIKWVVTSRPLDDGEQELLATSDQLMVSLEVNSAHISAAVDEYIEIRTKELSRRKRYGPKLCEEIKNQLQKKAGGTFLWVNLVCDILNNVSYEDALVEIEKLPASLDPFYQRIFAQISQGEEDFVKACMQLLQVMLTVYRPLREEEIASVMGSGLERFSVEEVVGRCASFITKRGNRIEFVHQSAHDYLARDVRVTLESYGIYGHGEIASNCLSYLSQKLKVNIIDSPSYDEDTDNLEMATIVENSMIKYVGYAATFVMEHVEAAGQTALIHNALLAYFRSHFLEWLECLAWLDELPRAAMALSTLENMVQEPSLLSLVRDASRFFYRHMEFIRIYPLQIYSSALAFSPRNSSIRINNLYKVPRWLSELPDDELTWSSLIGTISLPDKSWMSTLAISQDGMWIAASCYITGSKTERHVLLILSAVTYLASDKLALPSEATSLAFSPNTNQEKIAIGLEDGSVILWDVASKTVRDLGSHSSPVPGTLWDFSKAIAFTSDGKNIRSVSQNNLVSWNIAEGTRHETRLSEAEGILHVGSTPAMAISPDALQIASHSVEEPVGCIQLLDIVTQDHLRVKQSLTYGPYSSGRYHHASRVAFGPEKQRLWICDYVADSRIYDIATNEIRTTPVKYLDGLAFSQNGKKLLTYRRKEISVHDPALFQTDSSVDYQFGIVDGFAVSSNGHRLAVVTERGTLKIWDSKTNRLTKSLSDPTFNGGAMTFTPEGKRIVIASHANRRFQIWNLDTTCIDTINQCLSGTIMSLSCSPDGKMIACGLSKDKIELCDATTGHIYCELTGHLDWVECVTFSPDGKWLASSSSSWTEGIIEVKLWSMEKIQDSLKTVLGRRVKHNFTPAYETTISYSEYHYDLRFSEDGRYLITPVGPFSLEKLAIDSSCSNIQSQEELWIDKDSWLRYRGRRLLNFKLGRSIGMSYIKGDLVVTRSKLQEIVYLKRWTIDRRQLDALIEESSPTTYF